MYDLIRFVWRGTLGGAVVPLFFVARYLVADSPWFWFFLILSFWAMLPGAMIGVTLWFLCVRVVGRIGAVSRILIGVATGTTIMLVVWMCMLLVSPGADLLDFPRMIQSSLSNGAAVGVLAGLLCPAAAVFRREPKLSYLERARQHEAAQAEREYWKAQLAAGKPRENKGSV